MRSAITVSLVPEARGGPFVFWDDLEGALRSAANLGFDAIEIFPRSAGELPARLPELLREHNLKLAALGSGAGWVVQKLRLTDPSAEIRARAVQFAAEIIDLAGSLDAPAIIGSMQGRWEGGISREQALDWLAEALGQLAPRAEKFKQPLLLEPLNRYETNVLSSTENSLAFLDTLQVKNVKLLCDLFHMNIEDSDIAAALRAAGPRLGHLHFADSNRRAVGLGHTDIAPVVEALRSIHYTGYISGEILPWPDSLGAARQTIESYRRWFGPKS